MDNGLVRHHQYSEFKEIYVLILVVVDNGLVHLRRQEVHSCRYVLILVVVDNGLVLQIKDTNMYKVTKS